MISNFRFLLLAVVGMALASCDMFNKTTPSYQLSDLQGLWQENNTEHYVRFTTEQSDETGYLYGREWHEDEDKYEQDLLDAAQKLGHPGNGWFKYKLDQQDLLEIHLQDNQGAEEPKSYVVTKLNDTALEYYEKEQKSVKFYFTKMVEKQ
jgi:hypothetical protein